MSSTCDHPRKRFSSIERHIKVSGHFLQCIQIISPLTMGIFEGADMIRECQIMTNV